MLPANLLFILSDQHNRDCMGAYGHPVAQTPHLDRLASRGVKFTSAYTNCPICVPARASLATGRYVHDVGYWDNAHPYEGRIGGWGHRLIDEGIRCESIGKLHHRADADPDGYSQHHIPLNVVDGVGDLMGCLRDDPPIRNGSREGVLGAGPGDSTYLDYDVRIADEACRWIAGRGAVDREADGSNPWMLLVSFVCPHPPYIAPPDLYELYADAELPAPVQHGLDDRPDHPALNEFRRVMQWEEPFTLEQVQRMNAAYLGCCTHLDRQIGRVLDALEHQGLAGDTRLVYTSDHGECMGNRGLFGKFTMYEESAAVPLILAGPDVPAGTTCDDPVSLVDCYPTIVESLGLELSDDERQLPGDSLWRADDGRLAGRSVLSEYHAVASRSGYFMLRRGRYKYVYYVDGPPQLFDLESDPRELTNLAESADHAELLTESEAALREILDPEAVDARAKANQRDLIERHGGREAVLARGTFTNSPAPGETPVFTRGYIEGGLQRPDWP